MTASPGDGPLRALIVDDSEIMRRIVVRALKQTGISEYDQACDGQEALVAVSKNQYNLILMDWNMPNMNGLDTVKAIRSQGITAPIIMVTTELEKSRILQALKAGADNYIGKPFKPLALELKIRETLENVS